MPLSEEQLEDMYKKTLESSAILTLVREQLESGNKNLGEQEKRINKIEKEQSLLKGKIGAFIIFLTLCGTIIIQGFGWILAHLWTSKGT